MLYRKDPDALAARMQELVDNPDLASEYRERAPQRIEEAYQWDVVVRDYELLFEHLKSGYYLGNKPSD